MSPITERKSEHVKKKLTNRELRNSPRRIAKLVLKSLTEMPTNRTTDRHKRRRIAIRIGQVSRALKNHTATLISANNDTMIPERRGSKWSKRERVTILSASALMTTLIPYKIWQRHGCCQRFVPLEKREVHRQIRLGAISQKIRNPHEFRTIQISYNVHEQKTRR